jgi:hypothetical protein
MTAFHVTEIWRYPVKSMQGERLDACVVTKTGIPLDRGWAVRDESQKTIRGAKYIPDLLNCSARYLEGTSAGLVPHVEIALPDGSKVRSDEPGVHDALSAALGAAVKLWPLQPEENADHFVARTPSGVRKIDDLRRVFGLEPGDSLPDFSRFPPSVLAELTQYATPRGTYFDAYPIDVLTQASLRYLQAFVPSSRLDIRRFRPNFLIADDGEMRALAEEAWVGSEIWLGEARLSVAVAAVRCIMTTRAQMDLPQDSAVMKALIRETRHCLSVYANVVKPGMVRTGDALTSES